MKTRRSRILLAVLLVAVLGGLSWLVFRSREPVYQGRKLTEWLGDCSVYPSFGRGEIPRVYNTRVPAAERAVKAIGTNGIPVLLRMLRAGDSMTRTQVRCNDLLDQQSMVRFRFRPGYDKRELAAFGLGILGKDAAPAVPVLIGLLDGPQNRGQHDVIRVLERIGPAAKAAVPALVVKLNDDRISIKRASAAALRRIDPEAAAKAGVK